MWLFEITIYMIIVKMFVLKTCTMLLCVAMKNENHSIWILMWNLTCNHLKTKEILLVVT